MMAVSEYCPESTHRLKKGQAPWERGNNQEVSALPWKEKQHLWSCFSVKTASMVGCCSNTRRTLARSLSGSPFCRDTVAVTCGRYTWRDTKPARSPHEVLTKVWLGFFHPETGTLQKLANATYHLTRCTHRVSKQTIQATFNIRSVFSPRLVPSLLLMSPKNSKNIK